MKKIRSIKLVSLVGLILIVVMAIGPTVQPAHAALRSRCDLMWRDIDNGGNLVSYYCCWEINVLGGSDYFEGCGEGPS